MNSLLIGVLRRTHGIRGAIKVESYSGEADHFRNLRDVELVASDKTLTMRIEAVAVHNGVPVVTFEGVTTPEAAKKYLGWEMRVSRTEAAPLGDDEYYVADLIGSSVFGENGSAGVVLSVVEGAQAPLLEVELSDNDTTERREKRVFVPFMNKFIQSVDLQGKRITLKEPWILDSE